MIVDPNPACPNQVVARVLESTAYDALTCSLFGQSRQDMRQAELGERTVMEDLNFWHDEQAVNKVGVDVQPRIKMQVASRRLSVTPVHLGRGAIVCPGTQRQPMKTHSFWGFA